MKKNKHKTKIILILAIIFNLLLVGGYVYSFYLMKTKNEEASVVSDELNQYLSNEGTINKLKKAVRDSKDDRERLSLYFVSRDDIPDFAKKIESLGEVSGVELTILGFSTQGDVLSFDVSSQGSFIDTMHLISLLENLAFKIEITKAYINLVEIQVEGEDFTRTAWGGNFSVELTGFTGK